MDWERATDRVGRASVPAPATTSPYWPGFWGPADPESETGSGQRSPEDRSRQSGRIRAASEPTGERGRPCRWLWLSSRGGGGGSEFAWKWELGVRASLGPLPLGPPPGAPGRGSRGALAPRGPARGLCPLPMRTMV